MSFVQYLQILVLGKQSSGNTHKKIISFPTHYRQCWKKVQVHKQYLKICFDLLITFTVRQTLSTLQLLRKGLRMKSMEKSFETTTLDTTACCFVNFANRLKYLFWWASGFHVCISQGRLLLATAQFHLRRVAGVTQRLSLLHPHSGAAQAQHSSPEQLTGPARWAKCFTNTV